MIKFTWGIFMPSNDFFHNFFYIYKNAENYKKNWKVYIKMNKKNYQFTSKS